jgi:hypothetical protein
MKHLFLLTFTLILCQNTYAQNEPLQPFESLGKTVKVLTLSNGKYNESFPNDSIMRIGSVLYNRNTGELVSVIPPDTLQPRTDVPSRWLSIDPLAHKFAAWSPYNFVMNNPVLMIDPDGCAPVDTRYYDEKGNLIHHSKDNLKNATVIVTDANRVLFNIWFNAFSRTNNSKVNDQLHSYLRKNNYAYDDVSILEVANHKHVPAKAQNIPVNSKDKLYAEIGNAMVLGKDGVYTTEGRPSYTNGDPIRVFYRIPKGKNANEILVVHKHDEIAGKSFTALGERYNPETIYRPSGEDWSQYDTIFNTHEDPSSGGKNSGKLMNGGEHPYFPLIENGNLIFYRVLWTETSQGATAVGERQSLTVPLPKPSK